MNENEYHTRHCDHCYIIKCKSRDKDTCPVMECDRGCGQIFHQCKKIGHRDLCPKEKIPCANKEIGCESFILRSDLGNHLLKCPAYIVPYHLSSFPIEPPNQSDIKIPPAKEGDMTLRDLPSELLLLVFSFLDPWTLSNIGLVDKKCRDAVAGLVKKKGCVTMQWEKVEIVGKDGKPRQSWQITGKKWFFSPARRGKYVTGLAGVLPTPSTSRPVMGRVLN